MKLAKLGLLLPMVVTLVLTSVAQDEIFKLVLLSRDRGASCLDGSSPGIYINEGKGDNKNNYLLYFEGGGFCGEPTLAGTLQSCYKRSFTDLGSSSKYAATMNGKGYGALSPIQKENPLFFDWTKVAVKYCDGHEYIGHRENAIEYKDRKLFFRGSRNVKQLFYYMSEKYDFYNGGKIVIGGGSAGGMSSYQWVDFLLQNTKKAKVYGIPDSGFFITDYYSPIYKAKAIRAYVEPLMNLVFNQTQTPKAILSCLQNLSFDIVDCVNAGNYVKYIKSPLLIINSPYDQWAINHIVGTSCYTNPHEPYSLQKCNETIRAAIQDYRLKSLEYLKGMKNGRKNVGIWAPACVQHSFAHITQCFDSPYYQVNGVTLMKALQQFLNDPDNAPWLLDQIPWPQNKGCNGLTNLKVQSFV